MGGFHWTLSALISLTSLFLELLLIRWSTSEIRIFAYCKSLVLIACFLGFGLGCYLTRKKVQVTYMLLPLLLLILLVELPKSVHMRMVHSASRGEGIFHDHTLHRHGDRGVVIDVGQFVSPRAIHIEMLDHIGHQVLQAFARVIAGAEVMHVTKGALDRVGSGTISRQQEQPHARVFG